MKKILLVDDEPTNLNLLRAILRDRYQLLFATNGPAALDAARKHHPDLILLDVLMPGMDGIAVRYALGDDAMTRDIPVVFATALDTGDAALAAELAAAAATIAKPIDVDRLLALLADLSRH
jgi:putative two-component system response regulator